jgi:hypothetical protein
MDENISIVEKIRLEGRLDYRIKQKKATLRALIIVSNVNEQDNMSEREQVENELQTLTKERDEVSGAIEALGLSNAETQVIKDSFQACIKIVFGLGRISDGLLSLYLPRFRWQACSGR